MRSPLQKISAKQASLERRWGYFKAENRKAVSGLSERIQALEDLLSTPSAEHDSVPAASGAGHQGPLSSDCDACQNLVAQIGLPAATIVQIHDLHFQ